MGVEIIYPIGVALGLLVFALLTRQLLLPASRPYALATLVVASLIAVRFTFVNHKEGYFLEYLVIWFGLVGLVVGALAHFARYLVQLGQKPP